jgi:hypothetical protein
MEINGTFREIQYYLMELFVKFNITQCKLRKNQYILMEIQCYLMKNLVKFNVILWKTNGTQCYLMENY